MGQETKCARGRKRGEALPKALPAGPMDTPAEVQEPSLLSPPRHRHALSPREEPCFTGAAASWCDQG